MNPTNRFCLLIAISSSLGLPLSAQETALLRGVVLDSETKSPVPARLYVESESGESHLVESSGGVAVPYNKVRATSRETHTSLSADPFSVRLAPGTYRLIAERGKEYFPATKTVTVGSEPVDVEIELKRWVKMHEKGWFSGETHIHRPIKDLRTLVQCEDLNVALPLTAWVSRAEDTPLKNNRNPEIVPAARLLEVDETHVIWPVNTEYEITSVKGIRHHLGALFVLNQKRPLDLSAPPVKGVAALAREQGAVLDLDKHNWPWSMMLIPIAQVDLFELTNNHIWRTDFAFSTFFPEYIPEYMEIEQNDDGFTERGWIDFGFQNYYALLNCGFDIMPSAGTASGVHPVPLGFGRVYVKLEEGFDYDDWMEGLKAGRSFVTTGPMLEVTFNGMDSGSEFADVKSVRVKGEVRSLDPLDTVEVIVNGEVAATCQPSGEKTDGGDYFLTIDETVSVESSSWIAVRAFARREGDRPRFAHSAPVHVKVDDQPISPKRIEVEYLIKRVSDEIERHEGVLSKEAVAEFREAEAFYQSLLQSAR